jgi:hypothetical protein
MSSASRDEKLIELLTEIRDKISVSPPIDKKQMKRWTNPEKEQLLKEIEDEKSLQEMAEIHGRTTVAILAQRIKMSYESFKNGTKMPKIISTLALPEAIVKSFIEAKGEPKTCLKLARELADRTM